jgi:transketolase
MQIENSVIKSIEQMADNMRRNALFMAVNAGMGASHFGGGLSTIDVLAVLYGGIMRLDKSNPEWESRDRFILSKGHGVLGYYSALAEVSYISKEELKTFEKSGTALLGHPVINRKKGIEFTTGSLGMGLSVGIGVGLAARKKKMDTKVYVLMGDGECNEGSVWEAFMSVPQFKLTNIVAIIDRNRFQLGGNTEEVMDIGDMKAKLEAFGWEVREVNGHNIEELMYAFRTPTVEAKPLAVVSNTIKGKGFRFSENNNAWHHAVLTKEQYLSAIQELDAAEVQL